MCSTWCKAQDQAKMAGFLCNRHLPLLFYWSKYVRFCCWLHSLWFFWDSYIPTKLLCACHKFFWWCAPTSIESICDLSKIVKFKDHILTCELMIWDFIGHVLIHYSLGCIFNGKNISPSHWAMCTIIWLKRQPNILVWLILHGLNHYNDHWDHKRIYIYKKYLW